MQICHYFNKQVAKNALFVSALCLVVVVFGACSSAPPSPTAPSVSRIEYVGRVLSRDTNDPIDDAEVTFDFQGAPPVVYTDSEGVYRFTIDIEGDKLAGRVRVEAEGYGNYNRNITLFSDVSTIDDIRLESAVPTATSTDAPSLPETTVPPSLTSTPTPQPAALSSTDIPTNESFAVTKDNITYTVSEAKYNGGELILFFFAYNEGADKDSVCLRFSSSLIDASGNEHQQSDRIAGGRRGGGDCLPFDIPHAVPTRFGLAFDSLLPTVTHIPFVEVIFRSEGQLQFRNIPVPYKAE